MPRRGRTTLSRVDRNALERSRRLNLKELLSSLAFLLPAPPSKPSLLGVLDEAVVHVKQLEERVGMLKQKKQLLEGGTAADQTAGVKNDVVGGSNPPVFTLRELDFVIEVNILSGSNKKFMFHQVIQVLEEEAAQVVALAHSNVGRWTLCTIKAEAVSPRIGIEVSRVQERLMKLIV